MDEKELIRSKVDMVELVGQTVQLKRSGANWKGLCPFHQENSPSFMVNPEMGIFKCFGCGEGGDCFTWLMRIEGMSFSEALMSLAEKTGVELKRHAPSQEDRNRSRILAALTEAEGFYTYLLLEHQGEEAVEAREYIYGRGITEEALRVFGLGFAPKRWDVLQKVLRKRGFSLEELSGAGLIKKGERSWYDAFRGRLMFALKNVRGQTVGFAGRILDADAKGPKYINTAETPVYHKGELLYGLEVTKNAIRTAGRVVLVEGELDAISSWQVGVQEVVAIKGTALTEEQIRILKRYTNVLILALDMDMAGDKAARRGWQMAETAGMEVRVARIPEGKDPDELARSDSKKWKQVVDSAVEVYAFLLDSARERYDLDTAHGKRQLVEELVPVWQEIGNDILQSHWVGELAKAVHLDEALIWKQIRSGKREVGRTKLEENVQVKKSEIKTRRDELEELWVGGLLRSDPQRLLSAEIRELVRKEWLIQLIEVFERDVLIEQGDWQRQLPEALRENVGELLLLVSVAPDEEQLGMWRSQIELEDLKMEKPRLTEEIRQAELKDDDDLVISLQRKLSDVSKKIEQLKRDVK